MQINQVCRDNGHATTMQDKRYGGQAICIGCFNQRRQDAFASGDTDWFDANHLIPTLTEEEKMQLGV